LIPTGAEAALVAQQEAELERQKAESEQQRADRLVEKLRELGIDPDQV
jgi:aspartate/methionine/tyrosine aminotransferase